MLIRRIVRVARELGVKKIVITHAEFPSQNLTGDEQFELAQSGAIIEHCSRYRFCKGATLATARGTDSVTARGTDSVLWTLEKIPYLS